VLRRSDTVRIERFREDEDLIRIDIAFPKGGREVVTAWLDPAGEVDSLSVFELEGGDSSVFRSAFSDSAMITRDGDEMTRVPTAARVMPYYRPSLALTQRLLRRADLTSGETRTLLLGEVGRDTVRTLTLSRTGDTVRIADPRRLLRLAVDRGGNIVNGFTRDSFRIVRGRYREAFSPTLETRRPGWVSTEPPDLLRIGKCPVSDHPFSPVTLTIHDTLNGAPAHLRSDGRGPYVNEVDGVGAMLGAVLEARVPWTPWSQPRRESDRTIHIDLSDPVPGSGATRRGVVGDIFAGLTLYHHKDLVADSLFGPEDMAIGEEVKADRVELVFSVGTAWNRLWALSFGTMPRGYCERAPTLQDLTETTPPILKRVSRTTWTVRLPQGSIGRLWSNIERADRTVPTLAHGLYYSSGMFEISLLPR
jgi:hypothetical protein